MRLALTLNPFVDTDLLYAQQLGVDWIVGDVPAWEVDMLAAGHNRVEKSGLHMCSLACLPTDLVALSLSGDKDALDRICRTIGDVGKLGISSLGYGWSQAGSDCAVNTITGRGGSMSAVYRVPDRVQGRDLVGREEKWQALSRFLEHIVPVAEAAGVRLAYRTDISQASVSEEARILDSVAELDRLFQVASSPCHGLDLDHGFVTQVLAGQTGVEAGEVIRHFGRQHRIFAVRMRNLCRTDDGAREHFLDEDKVAVLRTLQAYGETGFEGPLCPIASPDMTDDTEWRHKGVAFSIGYLRALLQALG